MIERENLSKLSPSTLLLAVEGNDDQMSRPNILTVLGVHRKEDVISNLLAHCYNSSESLRHHILKALQVPETVALLRGCDYTRVGTGDPGIPDIVIVGREPDQQELLLIENKLGAGEGDSQTKRYASDNCRAKLEGKFDLDPSLVQVHYRYLTLFPGERPEAKEFQTVSYDSFLSLDWGLTPDSGSWAGELLGAWLQLIKEFYGSAVIVPNHEFLADLACNSELEGSFLLFSRFMESLQLPPGILLRGVKRESRPGRRYYLAMFGGASWAPTRMFKKGQKYGLDPQTCFDIHIQPQYELLPQKFSVYLHYETSPYHPQPWLDAHVDPSDYGAYWARRNSFVERFRAHSPSGATICVKKNMIAKFPITLTGLTIEAAQSQLSQLLGRVATAVNCALDSLPSGS